METDKKYRVVKKENGEEIAENVVVAKSMFKRMKGLMFAESMDTFDGLMIEKCNSIHTFFMRFKIDVIFLTRQLEVVKVIENISPWRMTLIYPKSFQVLELVGGSLKGRVKKGDYLEVLCTS